MFEFLKSGLKNCSCKFYEMSIMWVNLVFNSWIMVEINVEAFKNAWFTFEEIQDIIESEKEFNETWIAYDFDEVKEIARKEIFSKQDVYV